MVVGGLGQEEEEYSFFDVIDSDDEEDFLPDFKEYMEERELNYSRLENSDDLLGFKAWVFWNRQDDDLTLSYDHSVDSIPDVCATPKIRLNIRHALHKLISHPELYQCLVQFWAPTRTLEGRTLLTTQFQPFAVGLTYDTDDRNQLCSYRMGMCREYNNKFYADAESGEDQLGLPGRVFLNKLPECTPDVRHYTPKEYPQRDLALRCEICESWALPVFEQSSHTCVGVLEIAYTNYYYSWVHKEFIGRMYDIFQEFGLRCFDGYKHCKIQDGNKNKALTNAFHELNMVYESVCKIHDLRLALTWVSCRSCNHLLESPFSVLNYCDEEDYDDDYFSEFYYFKQVRKFCHLRKGQVAGRILSFPNLLYCSDVKQFHIDEFPLVPFARCCKLGGWFTMCLQSSYTGDELYVLEFFLPNSTENDENKLTKLRLILGTMEKNFKTFKLASGQGLGEVLSIEVIDFLYGQRSHSTRFIRSLDSSDQPSMDPSSHGQNVVTAERNILVVPSSKERKRKMQERKHKNAGVRIEVSLEEILKCSKMRREDAAKELKVSISTLKRVCRDFGIHRWPPRNIKDTRPYRPLPVENLGQTPQLNYDLPSIQASTSVAHIKPSFQDANMVTIRATCEKNTIKFRLSLSSRLVEMQQEVAKRLNLEGGTYHIKYKDEEDVLILIACDEDLQDCLHTSRSLGISSIAVLLELK